VRDNQTHEILVQDGYAREYSSDTGNYEFSFTSKMCEQSGGAVSNRRKRYSVYRLDSCK